jgi:hypothetical protein
MAITGVFTPVLAKLSEPEPPVSTRINGRPKEVEFGPTTNGIDKRLSLLHFTSTVEIIMLHLPRNSGVQAVAPVAICYWADELPAD